MRNPAVVTLFPIALLALAACGQSGPLYRPDKNVEPANKATTPAVTVSESDEEKKKKAEDARKPAAVTSPDAGTSPSPSP